LDLSAVSLNQAAFSVTTGAVALLASEPHKVEWVFAEAHGLLVLGVAKPPVGAGGDLLQFPLIGLVVGGLSIIVFK